MSNFSKQSIANDSTLRTELVRWSHKHISGLVTVVGTDIIQCNCFKNFARTKNKRFDKESQSILEYSLKVYYFVF